MIQFTEEQAKALLQKVIKLSKADECSAVLSGGTSGNVRFARNEISTSGVIESVDLAVNVSFGKRSGTATTNRFDDASLKAVVQRAEELAKLSPEDPEHMPLLPKQNYKPTNTYDKATAAITPAQRAKIAQDSIEPCKKSNLVAAGFFDAGENFYAGMNSKGNFMYQTSTGSDYTCTVRTEDGKGSGWVGSNVAKLKDFDAGTSIKTAIKKAKTSAGAKALEPGKYTVILEPHAAAGLISFMMSGFDARSSDEGRSFMSKKGGGTKLGQKVFGEQVNMRSDPSHPGAEVMPWDGSGVPRDKLSLVENGVVKHLHYSRYWAQKQGKQAKAMPGNILMAGGDKSMDELIASTERGVLVSRTWYIRLVDPQSMLLTGLTRDGTFYIENGKIKYPVKNFRFNESPVIMLNNVEALGKSMRVSGDESSFVMMIPPMKIRDFTFTSLSDAV